LQGADRHPVLYHVVLDQLPVSIQQGHRPG
jgi:hypothetical protein